MDVLGVGGQPMDVTESAAAVVSMYWMNHSIEWSLKKKIKNEISKVEVRKSEYFQSQKMFENFLSVRNLKISRPETKTPEM